MSALGVDDAGVGAADAGVGAVDGGACVAGELSKAATAITAATPATTMIAAAAAARMSRDPDCAQDLRRLSRRSLAVTPPPWPLDDSNRPKLEPALERVSGLAVALLGDLRPLSVMGEVSDDEFAVFVEHAESRLRRGLSAAFGLTRGREAALDALSWGWENWDRLRLMDNPVGYLYRVGQSRAVLEAPTQ